MHMQTFSDKIQHCTKAVDHWEVHGAVQNGQNPCLRYTSSDVGMLHSQRNTKM